MSSSSSIQTCLSLARGTFPCTANVRIQNEMVTDGEMSKARLRFSRGHALLRRQVHKSFLLHPSKTIKRRFTFPGNQEQKILYKKRRRFTSVALPTKFLLGGNISDPLNLRSLEDEKVTQQLTPVSSPMPISRHRTQVQVLIPPNIYDPLNLNTGEEIEFNLFTSKHRRRRRHRKSRREDSDCALDSIQVFPTKIETSYETSAIATEKVCVLSQTVECSTESETKLEISSNNSEDRVTVDKIVSPVVPQGSPAKFFKRYHSKKESEEKSTRKTVVKSHRSKTRLRRQIDYMRFRANAEKFCYGNHIIKWDTDESIDFRLHILNKDIFFGKAVMDIGCNSGEITLYIARNWEPYKIIGVDIDRKLINIAQRKVRSFKSNDFSKGLKFPKSMSTLYGSLTKVGLFNQNSSIFPDNIAFFEANYVPASEECLDTQKPEFDVILCLRVTKWIHLNFGDDGLKLAFKRMYAQLRIGGHLILEPQPWFTYSTSKKITPSIYKTYCGLKMRPETFCKFLLSDEVGFSSCELIDRIFNPTKVYRQPLFLLTKGFQTSCQQHIRMDLSAIPFHSDEWKQFQ